MSPDVGYLVAALIAAYGVLIAYDLCLDLRLRRRAREAAGSR